MRRWTFVQWQGIRRALQMTAFASQRTRLQCKGVRSCAMLPGV
jgi:hypothetical protein